MPDRYVREALLGSPRWQSLPDAQTQLFFVRLLLIVDDFGVFDGRDEVIAHATFPSALISPEELEGLREMLAALQRAELIIKFSNNGKPYIAILQWGNDLRGSRRYPAPPVDVDNEGLRTRGKFGKEIGWTNPAGCAPVSILLDLNGRPTVPQPPEWRPAAHLRPIAASKVGWRREGQTSVTGSVGSEASLQAASDTLPVTGSSDSLPVTGCTDSRVVEAEGVSGGGGGEEERTPPVITTPPPPNGAEKSEDETHWTGEAIAVPEATRLRWQGMFFKLLIPDEIERASEWLRTHDGERAAALDANGLEAFTFRWLSKSNNALGG